LHISFIAPTYENTCVNVAENKIKVATWFLAHKLTTASPSVDGVPFKISVFNLYWCRHQLSY